MLTQGFMFNHISRCWIGEIEYQDLVTLVGLKMELSKAQIMVFVFWHTHPKRTDTYYPLEGPDILAWIDLEGNLSGIPQGDMNLDDARDFAMNC